MLLTALISSVILLQSAPSIAPAPPTKVVEEQPKDANARIARLIGPKLKMTDGKEVPTKDVLDGRKNVVLYFSASWCPPCRTFTPKLISFVKANADSKDFVVILVGSDRNASSHLNYFKKFGKDIYAVPYDKDRLTAVKRQYSGSGIPNLVILDQAGKAVKGSYETNGKYSPKNRGSYIGPNPVLSKLSEMVKESKNGVG